MKKYNSLQFFTIPCILFSLVFLAGCNKVIGDGPVVSESRKLNKFTGIQFALQGNLFIRTGFENSIEIRGQKNIISAIETTISNNKLIIRQRDNVVIHTNEPIELHVSCKDPNSIQLSGSGNIMVLDTISPSKLLLESSGSGLLHLAFISADAIHTHISGSGKIEANSGQTKMAEILLSGSGQALLSGILADSVTIYISGSGNISVWANKYLDCNISGSGIVRYKGSPEVKKRISGSGELLPW